MQDLKTYLNNRRKFLEELANNDAAASVLGQLYEINNILNWIDEYENADANETPTDAHTNTPNANAETEA